MLSRFMTRREQFVLLFFGASILVGAVVLFLVRKGEEAPVPLMVAVQPTVTPPTISLLDEAPVEVSTVIVSVQGAVSLPGVYTFAETDRVHDALQAAGGLSPTANTGPVNLAAPLVDGTTLTIPKRGEEDSSIVDPSYAITSPGTVTPRPTIGGHVGSPAGKININTATARELETLPGIGPTYAQAIVTYREQTKFRTINDITEVSGIGEKRFESIRELITVQ
jgi:competence protein ComEA